MLRHGCRSMILVAFAALASSAADDPLANFPKPTPEVEALVKVARDPNAAAADKAKAWKDLQTSSDDSATTALVVLLRDENAKVAQSAADVLKQRDKAKVRETLLAALSAVPPEKWLGTITDKEPWRAYGYTEIILSKGNGASGFETVNVTDKNKKFVSAKIIVSTPKGVQVVAKSDKEITQASGKQFSSLCVKNETAFSKIASFGGDTGVIVYQGAPAADRKLMQLGIGVLSTDEEGRKAAAAWKKDYASKAESIKLKK